MNNADINLTSGLDTWFASQTRSSLMASNFSNLLFSRLHWDPTVDLNFGFCQSSREDNSIADDWWVPVL